MRKVSAALRKRAFATIKIVAKAMLDGEEAISYSDLSARLGLKEASGRGHGPYLDEAALMCLERGLPDITCVVVTKTSLEAGTPMPAKDSFNAENMWPLTGVHWDDIPEAQAKVRAFDWSSVRELGLQAL